MFCFKYVVGNGINFLCTSCPGLRDQNSALKNERDALQQQKIQLEAEITRILQQFFADITRTRQQLEGENARLQQRILQLECRFTNFNIF